MIGKTTLWFYAVLSFSIIVLVSGCNKKGDEKKVFTVGALHPEMNAFHAAIKNSVDKRAEEKGWKIINFTAGVSAEKQLDQMENLIALGVDVILVCPVDAKSIGSGVKKARDAGIPVYGVDRSTVGTPLNMTVQADNEMGGRQAAEGAVAFLKEKYGEPKGLVLELQGDMASNVAQLRSKGFNEYMGKHPNVKVISKPTEWKAERFLKGTQDVLGTQPVDAIFSHTDVIGTTPILSALDQLGKKIKVGQKGHIWYGAIDGSPTGLKAVREGWQDASYSQPCTDCGIVLDFVEKETVKGETIETGPFVKEGALWSPARIFKADNGLMMLLATTVVTKDNVDDKRLWGNQ
ncbi:MAG: sugar ABC transporter substrate-binding protein [Kiritimatiellia bacterium]|nr:sugar ABC transporter substrate-binding protein [Kiritimatiellia bacterium]